MSEQRIQLWLDLHRQASMGRRLTKVDTAELCDRHKLAESDLPAALKWLASLLAVSVLSNEEMARLARGEVVRGGLVSVTVAKENLLLRIEDPDVVELQLAASAELLERGIPTLLSGSTVAGQVASNLGITLDQLRDGNSIPLAEDRWGLLSNMSPEFYERAWRRWEREGNAARMTEILAVLGRLHHGQLQKAADHRASAEAMRTMLRQLNDARSARETTTDKGGREPIPRAVMREVWRRDAGRCVECGSEERIEYDHIIPVSKGGSNTARNLRILCERCNRAKSDSI